MPQPADRRPDSVRLAAALGTVRESERTVRQTRDRLDRISGLLASIRAEIVGAIGGDPGQGPALEPAQFRIDELVVSIDRVADEIAASAPEPEVASGDDLITAIVGASRVRTGAILGRLASGGDAALADGHASRALEIVSAALAEVDSMRNRLDRLLATAIVPALVRLTVAAENAAAAESRLSDAELRRAEGRRRSA
jgi:hypothetical protein